MKMPIKYTFNKDKKVLRTLITNIKAQEVKMATLGPVLSAYDLNINTICKGLNEATKKIPKGLNVSITLEIYKDKTFCIKIKGPSTMLLLKRYKKRQQICLVSLWKIFLIKKLYDKSFNFKSLLSTVLSNKITIS